MNFKSISFFLGLFIFPLSALSFLNILYSTYFDYFLSIESYTITFFLFPLLEVHPNAWIFVLSFVFIGNLTILNLIIAILIDLLKTKDEN